MKNNKYVIDNLEEFIDSTRKLVFNDFGKGSIEDPDEFTDLMANISPEDLEEMDQVLTKQESETIIKSIAKEQVNKNTKAVRYIINEKIFSQIIEAMNNRLVANILSSLASKGLIESAYDEKLNDFVFWCKEDKESIDGNPETD
jgi:hypothetical protein